MKQRGFTLVELIIVIVVIAVLAAITVVAYNGIQQRATDTTMIIDSNSAAKQLLLYASDNNGYPSSLSQLNNGQGLKLSKNNTANYSASGSGSSSTYTLVIANTSVPFVYTSSSTNMVPSKVTSLAPTQVAQGSSAAQNNTDGCGGAPGYYDMSIYVNVKAYSQPTVTLQRLPDNSTTGAWTAISPTMNMFARDQSGNYTHYLNYNSGTSPSFIIFRAIMTANGQTTTGPTMRFDVTNGC